MKSFARIDHRCFGLLQLSAMELPMRVLFIAAVFGILVQPAFAGVIDCPGVKQLAEVNHIDANRLAGESLEIGGSKTFYEWTDDQREQWDWYQGKIGEAWRKVEMYANIYQAFCKD
jgi:hypothetical protein